MPKKIRPVRIEGQLAYVPLTQGYEAVIDVDDARLVDGFNWYAKEDRRRDGTLGCVYAQRNEYLGARKQRTVHMHRVIMFAARGEEVDHRDRDGLNNTRSNLRIAEKSTNQRNKGVPCNSSSGHVGVVWNKDVSKWQVSIGVDGARKYIGLFLNIGDAIAARREAELQFWEKKND
jgi:hypothetical protein